MPRKTPCLKVHKINGEKTIALAYSLGIIDEELKIQRDEDHIYVPLTRNPSQNETQRLNQQIESLEISTYNFQERKTYPKKFKEFLEDRLPPSLLASLPRAIDFVGDIAIIEIPPELEPYKTEIGNAILRTYKNVQTVLAKAGAVKGEYRIREFSLIAGVNKTETVHKEHGCKFHVDLTRAYFSPRLSNEHLRVASMVNESETVTDMFAGVGPFSILIAKKHKNVKVYAVDINPDAVAFLERNIKLNRVERKVHPIIGDARQVVKQQLHGLADRVVMNLPEKALDFVDAACEAIKPDGGIIHFYSFVNGKEGLENLKLQFTKEIEKFKRRVNRIVFSRLVRETAPYKWQAVLDAWVS
ncbi:MAG: class I SAM-dependent methyltransferase family protein [Candidatus Bathyarchaeia archaeon]